MSHFHFKVLGMPQVRHDEYILTLRTRKALALLLYLALENRRHSREQLVSLLWPESDEAQGRASLRNALFQIRSLLAEDASGQGELHLVSEQDFLTFERGSAVTFDIDSVQQAFLVASSRVPANQQDEATRRKLLSTLQAAVDVYQGDFLDGFIVQDARPFEQWVGVQREGWHRRMCVIFDRLSQLHINGGEGTQALDIATRWLTHDALSEAPYQRLMLIHLIAGDRTAALQVYKNCRQMLSTEFHAQPSVETLALAERIKEKRVFSAPRTQDLPSSPMFLQGPLVGRAYEYDQLMLRYHTAMRGTMQVVCIEGEAGIGKTRLTNEFAAWATVQGTDVLIGRAFETGGHVPYQVIVEALRRRVEMENAPDDLLSDIWLAELGRLLPELRERYPDLSALIRDEVTSQGALFEAIARFLNALAQRAPVLFVLDDLQWADAATLDLLHYIGRYCHTMRLLLVFNIRRDQMIRRFNQWLTDLEHDVPVTYIRPGLLSQEETLQLLASLGIQDAENENGALSQQKAATDDILSNWLFTQTKGQPFYLIETLKVLLDRGVLVAEQKPDGTRRLIATGTADAIQTQNQPPPGVRALISTRLAPLSTNAAALLAAGAVLGQHFTFEQLSYVADLSLNDGLNTLDETLRSGFLQEPATESSGTYSFTHDMLREVVYAEANEARRRIFHRRAGDILQREGASPSELVRHAQASGQIELAFTLNVTAGDEAMAVFAARDAIAFYEQAQRLLMTQVGTVLLQAKISTPIYEHLALQAGRAYEFINDWEQARKTYEALLDIARKTHAPRTAGMALNHLAVLTVRHSVVPGLALSFLQEARRMAEMSNDRASLEETNRTAELLAIRALEGKKPATPGFTAQERYITELLTSIKNEYDLFNIHQGRWEENRELVQELHQRYAALGNRAMEIFCLSLLSGASIHSGQAQKALMEARTAYTMSFGIDDPWEQSHTAIFLSQAFLDVGQYEDALHVAEKSMTMAKMLDTPGITYLHMMGSVYTTLHLFEEALAVYEEMERLNEPAIPIYTEHIAVRRCFISAMRGAWTDACHYAIQALAARDYSTVGILFNSEVTRSYEIEALLRGGKIEQAEEDIRHFAGQSGSQRYRIPYLRSLAVLEAWNGAIEQAIAHLHEAASLTTQFGLPGEAWQIQVASGHLYYSHAEHEQAKQAYTQAANIVRELAEKIQDEALRARFIALPSVQHPIEDNQRYDVQRHKI